VDFKKIKNKKILLPVLITLAVLIIYTIFTYNGFVKRDEAVAEKWNTLQSQYQRRVDVIPDLVKVVKASSEYEQNLLIQLAEIRSQKANVSIAARPSGEGFKALEEQQANIAQTMNKIIAVVENYPDLKSQKGYLRLQDQIKGTERRIQVARKDFNEEVAGYNKKVRSFPSNILAGMFGFRVKDGFAADAGAARAPEVKFNN
jgi:LemA protein